MARAIALPLALLLTAAHQYVPSSYRSPETHRVVIQGLELSAADIQVQLSRRRPGQSDLTTPVRPVYSSGNVA